MVFAHRFSCSISLASLSLAINYGLLSSLFLSIWSTMLWEYRVFRGENGSHHIASSDPMVCIYGFAFAFALVENIPTAHSMCQCAETFFYHTPWYVCRMYTLCTATLYIMRVVLEIQSNHGVEWNILSHPSPCRASIFHLWSVWSMPTKSRFLFTNHIIIRQYIMVMQARLYRQIIWATANGL